MNTMELLLQRSKFLPESSNTPGEMFVDAEHFCFTCEDKVRVDDPNTPENEGAKIYGDTAIPEGRYEVLITFSQKFQKFMMLIDAVPGFTGIRIHGGVDHDSTLGCPLVGFKQHDNGSLSETLQASSTLFKKVEAFKLAGGRVWITVKNAA